MSIVYPVYPGVAGSLQQLKAAVDAEAPFTHIRLNDGEFLTMFGDTPHQKLGDGCRMFRSMGDALIQSFREVLSRPRDETFIGSYWINPLYHPEAEYNQGIDLFTRYVIQNGLEADVNNARWLTGDFWYSTSAEREGVVDGGEELLELFSAVRTRSYTTPVVLIGNMRLRPVRVCLEAHFIPVPFVDCWRSREAILRECEGYAKDDAVYVWCAGVAAKAMAVQFSREYPRTTHLDFGSVFDGVVGDYSRTWLERRSGPHWDFLQQRIIPYVEGKYATH